MMKIHHDSGLDVRVDGMLIPMVRRRIHDPKRPQACDELGVNPILIQRLIA